MSDEKPLAQTPARPVLTAATVHAEGTTLLQEAALQAFARMMGDVDVTNERDEGHEKTAAKNAIWYAETFVNGLEIFAEEGVGGLEDW